MEILMLGWEFPPYNVGGLGVACHGLAKSLSKKGNTLKVIIPKTLERTEHGMRIISASGVPSGPVDADISLYEIDSLLMPYQTETDYRIMYDERMQIIEPEFDSKNLYGKNLILEVFRFANRVVRIARKESFDVIHAHDWLTFPAAIKTQRLSGKPMIIHIHNTAFDRSGGHPNPSEYLIEKKGFKAADKIIAISNLVKNTLVTKYSINPDKIEVIHNGIDHEEYTVVDQVSKMKEKIVLFAGRVTIQKGPDYFVQAAKRISDVRDDVHFVLAGDGDMYTRIISMAADAGLSHKFTFTGKYTKEEGQRLMRMANVFVMPSISEPFGLVPFEAMVQGTPTVISKQSGISEVLTNTLKADFWDIDQLANKIVALVDHEPLHAQLQEYGVAEVKKHSWDNAADKVHSLFHSMHNQ